MTNEDIGYDTKTEKVESGRDQTSMYTEMVYI